MVSKYGHLILPRVFPDKIIPVTDVTDEAIVNVIFSWKDTFVGAGNLQIITNKFSFDYLCTVSGPGFVYNFNFLTRWRISS